VGSICSSPKQGGCRGLQLVVIVGVTAAWPGRQRHQVLLSVFVARVLTVCHRSVVLRRYVHLQDLTLIKIDVNFNFIVNFIITTLAIELTAQLSSARVFVDVLIGGAAY
jgi:hypothetical protein